MGALSAVKRVHTSLDPYLYGLVPCCPAAGARMRDAGSPAWVYSWRFGGETGVIRTKSAGSRGKIGNIADKLSGENFCLRYSSFFFWSIHIVVDFFHATCLRLSSKGPTSQT